MATVETRYEPNIRGLQELAMSAEMQGFCLAEAERGKKFAESISPRSGDASGTPYADQFEVEPIIVRYFRNGPRVGAMLINKAPHAAAVEFGNASTPRPQRIIGKTAAFLGAG